MIRQSLFGLMLWIFATPVFAGIPVEREMTCPVGGEVFKVVETLSCTSFGRTMSFRGVSSCEFVTRLPVCPGNGLPLYVDFSEDELEKLEVFMKTDAYQAIQAVPPWQRAYRVAAELDHTGSNRGFFLLLQALWYESDTFLKDAAGLDALETEAEGEVARAGARQKAYAAAIVSYALFAADRPEKAQVWFERAVELVDALGEDHEADRTYLKAYLARVSTCRSDMSVESCRPNAGFEPE
ncbi:hypothetical protein CHH27_24750 [Labrenzia sp. VG12]|nr:hypothetical protein CHH27_24750 [Labrenzia sp. VG12]